LNFENKIPKTATAVLHADMRQIEHHLLIDAMRNPLKYIGTKFLKRKKDSLRLQKIISTPKNLIFFTNNEIFKNAWFSSFLAVKDETKLELYLKRKGYLKSSVDEITVFQKGKILFAFQNERLLIALKKVNNIIELKTVRTVFEEVDYRSGQEELVKTIVNSKSDISYASLENDFVEANFKDGELEILGKLNSTFFLNADHELYNNQPLAFINTKIDRKHQLVQSIITKKNTDSFNKTTKLSLDSIMEEWNGSIAFNLKSIISQSDSIVTYDYDDDFNKIEKKSVQERVVPDLYFRLEARTKLFEYLKHKNAIQIVGTDTIFTTIPLYKMYVHSTTKALEISTTNTFLESSETKTNYKLNAYLNVEKYLENQLDFLSFPSDYNFVKLIKEASIQLSDNNELSAKVILKNANRNFAGQLVKP
jgi:hypothetical protein